MNARTDTLGVTERGTRTPLQWAAVTLAVLLAVVNGYVAAVTGETPFVAVALTFGLGLLLFFTPAWRPVLYAVAAVHVAALGVVWLLDGLRFPLLGAATGVLGLAFFAVVLRLFVDETAAE